MTEEKKKLLFKIATIIFVVSFCFVEIYIAILCVNAYFNGSFGILKKETFFELDGVRHMLLTCFYLSVVFSWPIILYQIIYIIWYVTKKLKDIEKNYLIENKNEKQNIKLCVYNFMYSLTVSLAIFILLQRISIFYPIDDLRIYFYSISSFSFLAIVPLIIYKNITKINYTLVFVNGLITYMACLYTINFGIYIGILFLVVYYYSTFVLIEKGLKNNN
ncbi:MAG: hypothetical protein II567_09515 [Candidatus Riflebacteria bacterium]|nr:hypothetical protein [Candidatus Riflebacteria bacterium]